MLTSVCLANLLTTLPLKSSWDIAMCAQFYYPVGDKRKSKRRYYLLSQDGKRKWEIGRRSLEKEEVDHIAWRDRNHVIWMENSARHIELLELSLANGKVRTLIRSAWSAKDRGERRFPAPIKALIDRFSPEPRDDQAQLSTSSLGSTIQFAKKSYPVINQRVTWKAAFGLEGLSEIDLSFFEGGKINLLDYGSFGEWRLLGKDVGLSAHEGIHLLFRLNRKTEKAWVVPADVVRVTARPSRDLWAGISERNLGGYTEPDVWTNALSIGNISDGKPQKILVGRVRISGISLRP